MLEGEYNILPTDGNRATLHLSSRRRLSARFNTCAAFRPDAIMRGVQQDILLVIKHRSEQPYRIW